MGSLFTGVAGLQANQAAVDVIANNIANLNTIAFKASRTTFEETLVQTMSSASAAGVNPMQVGMGVGVATIDVQMTQGGSRPTGRVLDLALVGNGFFTVNDGVSNHYTRDGAFQLDDTNRLVMGSTGYSVAGWPVDNIANGQVNTNVPPSTTLTIPLGARYAVPTGGVNLAGNLDSSAAVGATQQTTFTVYDSLGSTHSIDVEFAKTADNTWTWTALSGGTGTGTATFTEFGQFAGIDTGTITLNVAPGAAAQTFDLDFRVVSQLDGESNVGALTQDGLPVGILENYSIDSEGIIYGSFSNGATRTIGQVALTRFSNPAGLVNEGGNLWNTSANSGEPIVDTAAGLGTRVRSGYVEMSNVDLASEFANLIVAQRGFQANSRSITTSDEMLQEVMQLKR